MVKMGHNRGKVVANQGGRRDIKTRAQLLAEANVKGQAEVGQMLGMIRSSNLEENQK